MPKKHQVGIEIKTTADPKGAQRVEDALEEVENQARKVREELDKVPGLDPQVRAQIEGVADSMDRATGSARQMSTAKDKSAKSSRNGGLAMLEFSRAVEDAQYGIRGVLNNIPQLLSFMGAGAGLAGVVSLAAVGLTVLVSVFKDTEEEAGELAETLEITRRQIDDLYKEAAIDGTSAFRANMRRVLDGLSQQNQALSRNIELTREKRKAELRVAAAGQDLQLANIASQELSGGLTAEEAEAQRRAIQVSRIRSESEQKIIAAQEEVELLERQKRDAYQRQLATAERLERAEAERLRLIEERNALEIKQAQAEAMRQEGETELDDAFFETSKIRARGKIAKAGALFPEDMRERLVAIEEVLLPQTEDLRASLESATQSIQIQREELLIAAGQASKQLELVQSTETEIAEMRVQTAEVEARTEAQKEAIKEANQQMRQILEDGVVDAQERQQIAQTMERLKNEQNLANSTTVEAMRDLLREAQITRQEVMELKANIQRLEASRGR